MDGEQMRGVIPVARTKTGLFSTKTYTLVFTNQRLILAELTSAVIKAAAATARDETRAAGGGILRQMGAQLKSSWNMGTQYLNMDPGAILAEPPGNLALTPAQVRAIKVERRQRVDNDSDIQTNYLRVVIETTTGKRSFDTDNEQPSLNEALALANSFFGAAFKP